MTEENPKITPSSNRGVMNPSLKTLDACVDWFTCTFFSAQKWQELCGIMQLKTGLFVESEKGLNGYSKSARWDHIEIYYAPHADTMGMSLNMSGQGCRQFESTFEENEWSWRDFFEYVLGYKCQITRLDLALDDFHGYFTLKQIENKIKTGCVASIFRTARNFEEHLLEDGSTNGQTIYFGKTDVMVRFYDKYKERINKGFALKEDITFWQRTEVQLRHERANKAIETIVRKPDELGNFIKGILKRYIDFKIQGADKKKYRWKTVRWWERFLGNVEKVHLSETAPDKTILRTKNWIDTQVSPAVATLYEAFNDDNLFIEHLLKTGKSRMSDEQKELAEDFKNDFNRRLMVKDDMKSALLELQRKRDSPFATKEEQEELDIAINYVDPVKLEAEKLMQDELQDIARQKEMLQAQLNDQLVKQKQLELLISQYGELSNMPVANHRNANGTFHQYDKETGEVLF